MDGQRKTDYFEKMQDLLNNYKVHHFNKALHSAQSNHTERVNGVLTSCLRAYVDKEQREWDKYLPQMICAINTAKHESTKYSPYYVNFGRDMKISGDYLQLEKTSERKVEEWEVEIVKIRTEVLFLYNIEKAFQKSSKHYNLRTKAIHFDPGEVVWRKNFTLSDATKNIAAKLLPKYIKAEIVSGNGPVYRVRDINTGKIGS